jgi:hypothetical protein
MARVTRGAAGLLSTLVAAEPFAAVSHLHTASLFRPYPLPGGGVNDAAAGLWGVARAYAQETAPEDRPGALTALDQCGHSLEDSAALMSPASFAPGTTLDVTHGGGGWGGGSVRSANGGGGGGGCDPLSRAKLRGGVLCAASLLPVCGRQRHAPPDAGSGSSSKHSSSSTIGGNIGGSSSSGGGSGSGSVLRRSLNSGDISEHASNLRVAARESHDAIAACAPARQHHLGVAVITGGLGGALGGAVAHWLLRSNAASGVVLIGRTGRGGNNTLQTSSGNGNGNGTRVVTAIRADAACASEAAAALHGLNGSGSGFASAGGVTSVFNTAGAGVLTEDHALGPDQTPGRLRAVVAPKVGWCNLKPVEAFQLKPVLRQLSGFCD